MLKTQTKAIGILGVGSCLPDKVITNSDLEKIVDTSDSWIVKRTGISERRILDKDVPAYELGVNAAMRALEDSGISAEDIDLIIVTTETPDYLTPSTACIIQGRIGARKAAAFDLNAACSGFVYGMTVAQQFISAGYYKYILVVGCEGLSKAVDWEDRNTCILFGDGAGAAVIGDVSEGYGILGSYLGADGSIGHNITIPCMTLQETDLANRVHENKRVLWMDGSEVFKFAVRIMSHATEKLLEETGMKVEDLNFVFPHQANSRIVEGAFKKMGIPEEKTHNILHKYGNISSASIPVALDEAVKYGMVKKGDNIIMVGFGGGLTWASLIMKWSK